MQNKPVCYQGKKKKQLYNDKQKYIGFCKYDTEHDSMSNRKPKEKSKKYVSHG